MVTYHSITMVTYIIIACFMQTLWACTNQSYYVTSLVRTIDNRVYMLGPCVLSTRISVVWGPN